MTGISMNRVLVVLNVPPALEDDVIDWLLASEDGHGFQGHAVSGHSSDHDGLSTAEQVIGRRGRQRFEISIPGDRLDGFLASAKANFGAADVYYQVLPILDEGHFGAVTTVAAD